MPIYEYRCTACGHELEALQKLSDAPLTECPACHRAALSKKVSAAGFQLKGSGWYVTDFRDKGSKRPAKDEAKAGDKPNGGETKPATSTESTPAAAKPGATSETKTAPTSAADKTGS